MAQHVNNAVYLAYLEDCRLQVAAAHGWPPSRMQAEGFATVTRRQRILHPILRPGDRMGS